MFMKGRYITTQVWIAALSKPVEYKKDIHAQLAETIAERKRILAELEFNERQARLIAWFNRTKAA